MNYPYQPSTAAWPENLQAECAVIYDEASTLDRLSTAFSLIGNHTLSEQLYHISQTLRIAQEAIRQHCSDRLTAELHAAQQGSMNMLKAALAGVKMGAES